MYTHAHTDTCTNAQSSCKPFNAATQWSSVSNAALDFLARKQGALCCCFRAYFECFRATFPHVRIICNILLNMIIVILLVHMCVLLILVYFCVISGVELELTLCQFEHASPCFKWFRMGHVHSLRVIGHYISHDFVCHPFSWLAIHHGPWRFYLDPEIIHRSPV